MRSRRVTGALAVAAVGGALALGGCGDSGNDSSANGTEPADQTTVGKMKQDHAMKQKSGSAMKDDGAAMKGDEGAMHDQADDHGGAMNDG
jgi:hypothetical protein